MVSTEALIRPVVILHGVCSPHVCVEYSTIYICDLNEIAWLNKYGSLAQWLVTPNIWLIFFFISSLCNSSWQNLVWFIIVKALFFYTSSI